MGLISLAAPRAAITTQFPPAMAARGSVAVQHNFLTMLLAPFLGSSWYGGRWHGAWA